MPEHRPPPPSDPDDPTPVTDAPVRAVVDTNVFVSGLMGVKGPPRQIIAAWLDARFTLVTSLYLADELAHVLEYPRIAERIRMDPTHVDAILAAVLSGSEIVPGELDLPGVTRDHKDDAVVACAVEGRAAYRVSGDDDLLALEMYAGTQVVMPRQFLKILREDEARSSPSPS